MSTIQNRPGHCCACGCMAGRFCQRWMVLYATEVALCTLLDLDNGVLMKFKELELGGPTTAVYRWERNDLEPGNYYTVARGPTQPEDWGYGVAQGAKQIIGFNKQPEDELLLTGGTDDDPIIFGSWGVPNPVGSLGWQTFRRQADALAAFPSAQPWNF